MSNKRRGLLFIVSAPSGAGKTTLVERLVEQTPYLKMSRSYTSRRARTVRSTVRTIILSAANV
jgi:guanylate kinase